MKMKSLLTSAILMLAIAVHAQQIQSALDGKKFDITLMKNGTLDSKETLVFDKGMMDPLQCHQYGFAATDYQAKNAAGMSTFRAICKSEKEGTMAWQGKITDGKIDGDVVWTKEGQDAIHYTFKGAEAKAEK